MEKPKHTPIINHSKPKKTPTNFVRENIGVVPEKKSNKTGITAKKPQSWIKKQDESWDY